MVFNFWVHILNNLAVDYIIATKYGSTEFECNPTATIYYQVIQHFSPYDLVETTRLRYRNETWQKGTSSQMDVIEPLSKLST